MLQLFINLFCLIPWFWTYGLSTPLSLKLHFLVTLRGRLLLQGGGRCAHKPIYQIMGLTGIPPECCFKNLLLNLHIQRLQQPHYSTTNESAGQAFWSPSLTVPIICLWHERQGKLSYYWACWRMQASELPMKWNKGSGGCSCIWSSKEQHLNTEGHCLGCTSISCASYFSSRQNGLRQTRGKIQII